MHHEIIITHQSSYRYDILILRFFHTLLKKKPIGMIHTAVPTSIIGMFKTKKKMFRLNVFKFNDTSWTLVR